MYIAFTMLIVWVYVQTVLIYTVVYMYVHLPLTDWTVSS